MKSARQILLMDSDDLWPRLNFEHPNNKMKYFSKLLNVIIAIFRDLSFKYVKFIYSEKATKFCEISTLLLSYEVPVKSKLEILPNFLAFSEYMNFTYLKKL